MGKMIRCMFAFLLAIGCLLSPSFAADENGPHFPNLSEECIVVSSYDILLSSSFCPHTYTNIVMGDKIGETCTTDIYNHTEQCYQCYGIIKGGTLTLPKDSAEHIMQWYTVSCHNGTHIYEYRCSRCSFVTESFSRDCSGISCPEWLSL